MLGLEHLGLKQVGSHIYSWFFFVESPPNQIKDYLHVWRKQQTFLSFV